MIKNIFITSLTILIFTLTIQKVDACRKKEYREAMQLHKNSKYMEAKQKFEILDENGCPTSSFYLGIYYAYGIGLKQNIDRAIFYCEKFLDKNNKVQPRKYRDVAYRTLSELYLKSDNYSKSFNYLLKSAQIGNCESQLKIGEYYLNGDSKSRVAKDKRKAAYWLNKSAANYNIKAMQLIYEKNLEKYIPNPNA